MIASGISRKHIAILGENSYEWIVAFYAITSGGGVAVLIDTEQTDDTVKRAHRRSDTDICLRIRIFIRDMPAIVKHKKIQDYLCLA